MKSRKLFILCINQKKKKKKNKKVYSNISRCNYKIVYYIYELRNSKTPKLHELLKLTDKFDLRRGEKSIAL